MDNFFFCCALLVLAFAQLTISFFHNQKLKKMDETMQNLTDAVSKEGQVIASAVALLNGLSSALKTALMQPNPVAAVQAVVTTIDAQTQTLADAVAANTIPAAPAAGSTDTTQQATQ